MEGTLPSVHAVFQSRRYSSSQIKERSTIQRFMRKVYNSPLASIPASGLRMPISFRPNFLIQNLVDIPLLYCAGLVFVPYRSDRFSAVKRWVSEINVVFFRLAVFDKTEGFTKPLEMHNLPLPQEPDGIVDIGVVTEPQDIVVGNAGLLLWCNHQSTTLCRKWRKITSNGVRNAVNFMLKAFQRLLQRGPVYV